MVTPTIDARRHLRRTVQLLSDAIEFSLPENVRESLVDLAWKTEGTE